MYLSHMLTRHQKACSDGMFISSMAARGAYLTKKMFSKRYLYWLQILLHGVQKHEYQSYLCLTVTINRVENGVSFEHPEQLGLTDPLVRASEELVSREVPM